MGCLGKPTGELKNLDGYDDETIKWILSEHVNPDWLRERKPEHNPRLRRYMRLTQQEAHKRGLLGT